MNLAIVVDSNLNIPNNSYDQTAEDKFLSGSYFCLPYIYKGLAAAPKVKSFFENLCERLSLPMDCGVYTVRGGNVWNPMSLQSIT